MRYVDGLGISRYGENIVLEASSGAIKEDVNHSNGDSLKLIQCASEILKSEMMDNLDAAFSTFTKREVLIVQTIKNKMTLSAVSLSSTTTYKVIELRSGKIPLNWEYRNHWLHIFELLSTVMVRILTYYLILIRRINLLISTS